MIGKWIKEKNISDVEQYLQKFSIVDLSFNSLTDQDIQFITPTLKESSVTTNLNLYLNHVTEIGSKYLGEVLKENRSLLTLDLGNNPLGSIGLCEILEGLKHNKDLEVIDFSNTGIKEVSAFSTSKINVEDINLSQNRLGDESCIHIAKLLSVNSSISSINLSQTGITGKGIEQLGYTLRNNTTCMFLGLNQIEFGEEGVKSFADILSKNSGLLRVDVNQSSIGGDKGLQVLVDDGLMKNSTLKSLSIGTCKISDIGPLAKHLSRKDCPLMELNVGGNRVRGKKLVPLFEALQNNRSLVSLSLNGNEIGDEDEAVISHLGQMIKNNKSLKELKLNGVGIGDKGMSWIIRGLWDNETLESLTLVDNRITQRSVEETVRLLKEGNSTLKTLDLRKNEEIRQVKELSLVCKINL